MFILFEIFTGDIVGRFWSGEDIDDRKIPYKRVQGGIIFGDRWYCLNGKFLCAYNLYIYSNDNQVTLCQMEIDNNDKIYTETYRTHCACSAHTTGGSQCNSESVIYIQIVYSIKKITFMLRGYTFAGLRRHRHPPFPPSTIVRSNVIIYIV